MPYLRRTFLVAVVVLVTAFVALHPYLGPSGHCEPGGCTLASEAHASVSIDRFASAGTTLAASAAALALAAFRRPASDRRPATTYLSPEPYPPRF